MYIHAHVAEGMMSYRRPISLLEDQTVEVLNIEITLGYVIVCWPNDGMSSYSTVTFLKH